MSNKPKMEMDDILNRWRSEKLASELDKEVQALKVALSELDTVRPKKETFVKKSNVFFREKRDVIVKSKKKELQAKEEKRHELGLILRNEIKQ